MSQPPPEITTVSTRIAYENRWLRLREDQVRRQDGSQGLYGVVERSDFVVVAPWQDGCLTLVEQYRYPVRQRLWEMPMGMWEQAPGTDPHILAAAELREETGLIADSLVKVGTMFQGAGYCNQLGHIFLATGLHQAEHAREVTEQGMICRAFPLAEIEAMIQNGVLQDAMTIAAFGLLRLKGML
ncbi:MAG: NUDIX hydrolase [Acetobacteraceae bacterium]